MRGEARTAATPRPFSAESSKPRRRSDRIPRRQMRGYHEWGSSPGYWPHQPLAYRARPQRQALPRYAYQRCLLRACSRASFVVQLVVRHSDRTVIHRPRFSGVLIRPSFCSANSTPIGLSEDVRSGSQRRHPLLVLLTSRFSAQRPSWRPVDALRRIGESHQNVYGARRAPLSLQHTNTRDQLSSRCTLQGLEVSVPRKLCKLNQL